MFVGHKHAGELWTDILGWRDEIVLINSCGCGVFPVAAMSVSVWVNSRAQGREDIDQFDLETRTYTAPKHFCKGFHGSS